MPRMPGEFAPHERTVIAWPTRDDVYGEHLDEAREAHSALARTISGYEPVTMIANQQEAEYASELCGSTVDVVALPIDDSWFRDSGPIYVFDDKDGQDETKRVAGNWIFNGWGQKFVPFDKDAAVASAWAKHAGHPVRNIDMVLEGGSITSDGAGLLATTEQCLLHPNRNPQLSKTQIEQRLRSEFDLDEVMWLPHGLSMDADTDGHVDNVAIFIAPRTMVFQTCNDKSLSDHVRLEENRKVAQSFGVTMHEIPVLPVIEYHGERVQVPYLNFYMINGAVIVPVCGHAADDDMLALIGEYVPDRDIIGLDIGGILAYGGGGIHCITQQIPAVV